MSYIIDLYVYKQPQSQVKVALRNVLDELNIKYGEASEGRVGLKLLGNERTTTLQIDDFEGKFKLVSRIGALLNTYWCFIQISEGYYWSCVLYRNDECIDRFFPIIDLEEPDVDSRVFLYGNPELFSKSWNVPCDSIKKYFRQWRSVVDEDGDAIIDQTEKAYEDDVFRYGESEQYSDFLRSIGAEEPAWRYLSILS